MRFARINAIRGSISFRIAALFCVAFSSSLALAFAGTFLKVGNSLEKSSKEVIRAKHNEVATLYRSAGIDGVKGFMSQDNHRVLNAPYMVRLVRGNAELLYLKPSVQEKKYDFAGSFTKFEQPAKEVGWRALSAINDEDKFDFLTEEIANDVYLQIGKSSEDREDILGQILTQFCVFGIGLVLAGALFSVFYARRALAPLRELSQTIKKIEKGGLGHRVQISSRDEIGDVAETFNRMISRIEGLVESMKESLDNVAHDIRTPLTRIRSIAELAIVGGNPTELQSALEDCAESATEISEMVDQLLSISEANAGTLALALHPCSIPDLLRDVVQVYDFVAQEKDIQLSFDSPPLEVQMDRKRIKQAVANLLDNAIKFSPPGSSVELRAAQQESSLHITVSDSGQGVPVADLDRIWERLFRSDKSRSTKGLGLGLAIVKAIVHAHGGKCRAVARHPIGTTFTIILPIK